MLAGKAGGLYGVSGYMCLQVKLGAIWCLRIYVLAGKAGGLYGVSGYMCLQVKLGLITILGADSNMQRNSSLLRYILLMFLSIFISF